MSRDMQTEARVGDRVTYGSKEIRTIVAVFEAVDVHHSAGQPTLHAILGDIEGRLLPSHIVGATNLDAEGPIRTYHLRLVPPVVGDRIEAGVIRARFEAWHHQWAVVEPPGGNGSLPALKPDGLVKWSVVEVDEDTPVLGRWYS